MKRRLATWRPRFRIATLFWLTAIIAAIFVGRQSYQIRSLANRWWEVTRVRFGGDVNPRYPVVNWPPGSLTINENVPIQAIINSNPNVADVRLSSSRQLQISPKAFGQARVSYKTPGGRSKSGELLVRIEADQQYPDWTLSQQ
jgi:Flp pilus assembly secretin CpaC